MITCMNNSDSYKNGNGKNISQKSQCATGVIIYNSCICMRYLESSEESEALLILWRNAGQQTWNVIVMCTI